MKTLLNLILVTAISFCLGGLIATSNSLDRQVGAINHRVETIQVQVENVACSNSPQNVLRLINDYREDNGLYEFAWDDRLAKSAKAKGEDMTQKNYWAHIAPDGTSPWDFMRDADYKFIRAGENLGRDYSDGCQLVLAWEHSPTHNELLLTKKSVDAGVAVVGKFTILHVGSPR